MQYLTFLAALLPTLVHAIPPSLPSGGPGRAPPSKVQVPTCSSGSTTDVPIPPSQDPWYTGPAGFESASLGTILKIRCAPGNLTQVAGNASEAYHILYRTTDSRYRPAWAVTTVFVPSAPSHNSQDLLSYQIPYNSINVDASPSYALYGGVGADIADALGRGWYVNTPDFEGPQAANVAGIQEGHATTDSLRAVLASGVGGLSPQATVALWGYSGGSIASEWALELQEQYAPEVVIAGSALGGLVSNNTRCIDVVQGTALAYIAIGAMIGPLIQYPEAYERLVSQLKVDGPYNRTGFLAAYTIDPSQYFATYAYQNIYDYFVNGADVLHDPLIRQTLLENQFMTYHGVPRSPMFIYKAIGDDATPIEDTDYYYERNCMLLATIHYERNTVGDHLDEIRNGNARAVAYLASVFDGTSASYFPPGGRGCTVQNVTVGTAGNATSQVPV